MSTTVPSRFFNTVDGRPLDAAERIEVVDPATGRVCCTVPRADREDLDRAVSAAARAQPAWAAQPPEARRESLLALVRLLRRHREELAALIVLEQGKPLPQAQGEVDRAASQLELLMAIPLDDEHIVDSTGKAVTLHYRPLGVVGAITPWNMPLVLLMPKIGHALYTGNTIVVKPSPLTPLAALRVGELAADLLPRGVLNVLAGDGEFGQAMAEHPGIAKIAFTGSVATGKRVMASAASTLKRLTLELGGNDPAIVLPDVDVAGIAPRLFAGAFANAGQVCMAIKRLYVHDSIHDEVCEALAGIARGTRVAAGSAPGAQMGPLQNAAQLARLRELLDEARRDGAQVLGGAAPEGEGYFLAPTIVTGLREGSRLVDEEQFGPVLPVLRYTDLDDAIARANTTRFGLGASVWSRDTTRAREVARRLEAGSVWVNHHIGADVEVPFGGCKESGLGCQYSLAGLRGFMQMSALYAPA